MFSQIFPVNTAYPAEWTDKNVIGGDDVVDTREIGQVSLKMEVGHYSHPVINGRDSITFTSLMEETRCHIHYPDEGLMVTVVGDVVDVEIARAHIRKLLPLRITIHLPVREFGAFYPTVESPFIQELQSDYSVRITDVRRPFGGRKGIVSIEGSEIFLLKKAYKKLLDYYRKSSKSAPIFDEVCMMLHVCYHHFTIVKGKDNMNFNHISKESCATIEFPDTKCYLNQSISIKGKLNNVLQAHSMLLGCLPLMLVFDVPGEAHVDSVTVAELVQNYDINVSIQQKEETLTVKPANPFAIRQKKKGSVVKTVYTVIGFEWNAESLYEVRRKILNFTSRAEEKQAAVLIPTTYSPFENNNNIQ